MEIGSEFSAVCTDTIHNDEVNWPPYGNDHAFVFSGRTAIETVLRDIGGNSRKALLPSYCCASMIEPFQKAGYSVTFYEVNVAENFYVNLSIPEDCSVLLWCNYFGFRTDYPAEIIQQFRMKGGIVIEDITHSLFSEEQFHTESDYLVASLRKWGALLSGGFCCKRNGSFSRKPENTPDFAFLNMKEAAMSLKEEYLRDGDMGKKSRYLKLFSESNQWLAEHWSGLVMDEASKTMLSKWDFGQIRATRRANANALYEGLKQFSDIVPLFPVEKMDCPLFVPVCIAAEKRDEVRRRLTESEIYCPVHWPRPKAECVSQLYDTELSLICDQRYHEDDMHRILSVLQTI